MAAIREQPVESTPVRRGWWRRNWKRLVGGLFLIVLLGAGGVWYQLFGRMFLSEPYKMALTEIKNNKRVVAELGEPIGGGFFPHGMINMDSNIPEASMNFPISGPKGKAQVAVLGRFINGSWGFPRFEVTLDPVEGVAAGKHLDLAAEINAGKPNDTPTFDPKDTSKKDVTTGQATPEQDIKIDLDIPPAGK